MYLLISKVTNYTHTLEFASFIISKTPRSKKFKTYSHFEKGCQKKCTRQSRKVLWVVLTTLFFKEISKNGRRGHGHMFASAKGKQQK